MGPLTSWLLVERSGCVRGCLNRRSSEACQRQCGGARVASQQSSILRSITASIARVLGLGRIRQGVLSRFGSVQRATLACLLELPITLVEDRLLTTFEHRLWRHIADRAVKPRRIIVVHELCDSTSCIIQAQRTQGTDTLSLDRAVIPLNLAVALRIVGKGGNVARRSAA